MKKLPDRKKRRCLVQSYVTETEKQAVRDLARTAEMTESDLVRLLLATATADGVERLKSKL